MKHFVFVYGDGSGECYTGQDVIEAFHNLGCDVGYYRDCTLEDWLKGNPNSKWIELPEEHDIYAKEISYGAHIDTDRDISHTGEYIKKWCEYQISFPDKHPELQKIYKQCHIKHVIPSTRSAALEVYELFNQDSHSPPNPNKYYFVKYSRKLSKTTLIRDLKKSPRI